MAPGLLGRPPVGVALETEQLQSISVTEMQLGVKGSSSQYSVATLKCFNSFFPHNLLTSMNYFFLFKAYLRVDSSLSL